MNTNLNAITEDHLILERDNLHKWIFEIIGPYIKAPTMEIESGLGCMSTAFAEKSISIQLSDTNRETRHFLREKFKGIEYIQHVHNIDFCRPDFELYYAQIFGAFRTIIALNVLEKGYYEKLAFQNAKYLLSPGGNLIFLAPACTAMFYGLAEDLDNWKLYNRQYLKDLLKSDYKIVKTRYLNLGSSLGLSVLAIASKIDKNASV